MAIYMPYIKFSKQQRWISACLSVQSDSTFVLATEITMSSAEEIRCIFDDI